MAKENKNEKEKQIKEKKQEFEKELKRKYKKLEKIHGEERVKKEKQDKKEAEKEKEEAEEEKEEAEEKEEIITETKTLEGIMTPNVTSQSINTFQETVFPEERGFVAPTLGTTEEIKETRLEETAQRAPAPVTPSSANTQIYSANTGEGNIPYSPDSQYEASTAYSTAYRTSRQEAGRREERFDIREGLIADASRIAPTLTPTIANPFIRDGKRIMPQREDLEKFEVEQRKYKEKLEKDTRRRRR